MAARVMVGLGAIAAGVVGWVSPAFACGGLVGENGTIQLVRTSTLVAYHAGVERYVTSFAFTGEGKEVGSIIPLPAVPTTVERGGDWTLQRLALEVAPPAAGGAQTALDVRRPRPRRRGGPAGDEDRRARHHRAAGRRRRGRPVGARPRLLPLAGRAGGPRLLRVPQPGLHGRPLRRQPCRRARSAAGDGTPIMLTIPVDRPWVPLRILGLGAEPDRTIDADVFLLTDDRPQLLTGGPGLALERSEAARPWPAVRSAVRQGDGVGARRHVADLPAPLDARRRARPTTSRCRRMRRSRPSLTDVGFAVAPPGRGRPPSAPSSRAGRCGRSVPVGRAAALALGTGVAVTAWRRASRRRGLRRSRWRGGGMTGVLRLVVVTALAGTGGHRRRLPARGRLVVERARPGHGRGRPRRRLHALHPDHLTVRRGTLVRFVVRNHDPIRHELIVGPPEVHARHASGHEAVHPPVPGRGQRGAERHRGDRLRVRRGRHRHLRLPPARTRRVRDERPGRGRRRLIDR